MNNSLNDSTLLDEFKNGDNSSFKTLFLKHKRRIFNYINSKTLDSQISNDILQETFIKVFKLIRKGSYIEQGKFVPWVIRISHNLVMDYYRNKKRSKIIYEKDMKYSFLNVDHEKDFQTERIISDKTLSKTLKDMIDKLPESQKEIVRLRFYENFSFKEIAEMNNISINTALGRVRYSINNLRKEMDKSLLKKDLMELV